MRIPILIGLAALTLGCPQKESAAPPPAAPAPPPPEEKAPEGLVLVEAELATRMQNGRLKADEFCESSVPLLHLHGSTLEMQCGQEGEIWHVLEERKQGNRRMLMTKQRKKVVLEEMGRQRYRVIGSYCDRGPTFYVSYPEAKAFREKWLRSVNCPTEDMKLAP